MRKFWFLALVFIVFQACSDSPPSSPPKSGSFGKIEGVVYLQTDDAQKELLNGVEITTSPETKVVTSNPYFDITEVPAGEYTVRGKKAGFIIEPETVKVVGGYPSKVELIAKIDDSGNENRPPVPPYNPQPEDKSAITTTSTVLRWQCKDPDGDELHFDVYFGREKQLLEKIAGNIADNGFEIRDLQRGKTYFWKVVANDGNGGIAASDIWQFTVTNEENSAPVPPFDPDPTDQSEINSTEYTFNWECYDPDGDILHYQFYLGRFDSELVKVADKLEVKHFYYSNLQPGARYKWKVVAIDPYGAVAESDIWTFTVVKENRPPVAPFSPNPADNSVIRKSEYILTWQCYDPDQDPLKYDVLIAKNNGILEPVALGITSRNIKIQGLEDNSDYRWKVIAKDDKGGVAEGEIWKFSTKFDSGELLRDLIAFYPFDGNAKDAGPNAYHGKMFGTVADKDRFNREGKALFFGRGQEYVELSNPEAFNFNGDYTIALWIKPNLDLCIPFQTHIEVIGKSNYVDSDNLYFGITNELGTEFWINDKFIGYDFIKLKNKGWNHIAVVFRRSGSNNIGYATLYLNGTQLGQSKELPVVPYIRHNVRIGDRGGMWSFGGSLDDIYFFNRALSSNEIRDLMLRRTD